MKHGAVTSYRGETRHCFGKPLPVPVPDVAKRSAVEIRVVTLIGQLDDLAATVRMRRDRTRLKREITDLKHQIQERGSHAFRLTDNDQGIINAVPIPD